MIILKKDHSALYKAVNILTNFDQSEYNPSQKAVNQVIDVTANIAGAIVPQTLSMIPTAAKYTARAINNFINQPKQRNIQQFQFENNVRTRERSVKQEDENIRNSTSDFIPTPISVPIQMLDNIELNQQMQKNQIKKRKALQRRQVSDFKLKQAKFKTLVPYHAETVPIIQVFQSGQPLKKQQFRTFVKQKMKQPSKRIQQLLKAEKEQRVPSRLQFIPLYKDPNNSSWQQTQPKLI